MLATKQVIAPAGPGVEPALRDAELRSYLVKEEAKETVDAYEANDLIEVLDGLCDVLYVTLGAFEAIGVDAQTLFDEVHRTNMAKIGGPVDPVTGKQLKPPGWKPPDLASLLDAAVQARTNAIHLREGAP